MSIKAVHLFFVTVLTTLCCGIGISKLRAYQVTGTSADLFWGLAALVVAATARTEAATSMDESFMFSNSKGKGRKGANNRRQSAGGAEGRAVVGGSLRSGGQIARASRGGRRGARRWRRAWRAETGRANPNRATDGAPSTLTSIGNMSPLQGCASLF